MRYFWGPYLSSCNTIQGQDLWYSASHIGLGMILFVHIVVWYFIYKTTCQTCPNYYREKVQMWGPHIFYRTGSPCILVLSKPKLQLYYPNSQNLFSPNKVHNYPNYPDNFVINAMLYKYFYLINPICQLKEIFSMHC